MRDQQPDTNYPVLVKEWHGVYHVSIRELLLAVRGSNLHDAYEELMRRKQEVVDWARSNGALDELPPPELPPLLGRPIVRPLKRVHAILAWLRSLWQRTF